MSRYDRSRPVGRWEAVRMDGAGFARAADVNRTSRRHRQRGAALAISLIAITALLGLGALTVLSVQSELAASGQSRFTQAALYAAESGTAAAMDYLRNHCKLGLFYTDYVTSGNVSPLPMNEIVGNHVK